MANIETTNNPWEAYEIGVVTSPPDKIWWELCPDTTDTFTYMQIVSMARKLQESNAEIYISTSPIRFGYTCPIETYESLESLINLKERLIQDGVVLRGPEMTPLTISQVGDDLCHPNIVGKAVWGRNLIDFFNY